MGEPQLYVSDPLRVGIVTLPQWDERELLMRNP